MRHFIIFLCTALTFVFLAFVFSASAQTAGPELEAQARDIGQSLRCVVCQNQSINESDAPLANDMRKLIRKQLSAGKTKTEIIDYMQDNYGDYVLLKPPVQRNTYILWFGPFLLLALLLGWFIRAAGASKEEEPS